MEKDIRQVVAGNVRYLMSDKNMSTNYLVYQSGVNSQSIQNLLNVRTKNGITIVILQKLAKALGVNSSDLVDDRKNE
ncbi:helix-turn-helix domain-containing protein [Loigolactobacillus backii]|uniref:helix-turn-helix domain-containing protein n=1 Tax=Loigolactobacillus backii TaxID=375175 RepID=UPI0007F1498D|nr:helix-turn-helix transcriptional regulator [Loigolactobacillus backii]ANK59828.1 hypothetical protein AYR52_05875 [Loigolactobacillus backii]